MTHTYKAKKTPKGDWHREDIKAALAKAGWSLSKLAIHHKYKNRRTLINALTRPWPKGERIICQALRNSGEYPNIQPQDIWPSRYVNRLHPINNKFSVPVKK